jgi:HSP20 family molecular chaperone IbpA
VRRFTISDAVDADKIKATMKNGVLELYLPKAEKAKPKKIEILAQ